VTPSYNQDTLSFECSSVCVLLCVCTAVSATATANKALVLPLFEAGCSQSAQRLCNSVDSTHTHTLDVYVCCSIVR
jgi:hypothetical protein